MEIFNKLKALADKVDILKDKITTEESTKHALVLPFISILGYDAFNPMEVVPEYTADVGIKKGEKVDYTIFLNNDPILIIECKHWDSNLSVQNSSQLFRYFHVTKTRFALLTNGINYKFYTDLEETNKMDKKPFLEFDITKVKESTAKEIEKFHKSNFDVAKIFDNASDLKYTKEIIKSIEAEIAEPSNEFVKLFASKVYQGRLTANVLTEFASITRKAFNQFISEKVNDRLNSALSKEEENQKVIIKEEITEAEEENNGIITTEEELQAYRIVVAIVRRKVPTERIAHRDTKSYFGILLDNNNRKPICRLHLNTSNKYIGVFDEHKNETRHLISSIDEIYNFEQELLNTIDYYES